MHNVLAVVPKGNAEMAAASIRTIFAQPDTEHVEEQFDAIPGMLGRQLPKVEATLREAKEDPGRSPDFRRSSGDNSGPPTPLNA